MHFRKIATNLINVVSLTLIAFASSATRAATDSAPTFSAEAAYTAAAIAEKSATILKSQILPADVRSALLEGAASDDKPFVKNLVAGWKPMKPSMVCVDFDSLVLLDVKGFETTRIKAETETSFVINGRRWIKPTSGSIEKSLRRHIDASPSAARSSSSKAYALSALSSVAVAADVDPALNAAYIYIQSGNFRKPLSSISTPAGYAIDVSAGPVINDKNPFLGFFFDQVRSSFIPATVICNGSTATGKAKIGGEAVRFESRPDGKVVITFDNPQATGVLVSSEVNDLRPWAAQKLEKIKKLQASKFTDQKLVEELLGDISRDSTRDQNAAIAYSSVFTSQRRYPTNLSLAERLGDALPYLVNYYKTKGRIEIYDSLYVGACEDPKCLKVSDTGRRADSIQPWLKSATETSASEVTAVKAALAWKPTDSEPITGEIKWQTAKDGVRRLALESNGRLSGKDLLRAEALIATANTEMRKKEIDQGTQSDTRALRPLGACCGDEVCRRELAGQGVNLVPNDGKNDGTRR